MVDLSGYIYDKKQLFQQLNQASGEHFFSSAEIKVYFSGDCFNAKELQSFFSNEDSHSLAKLIHKAYCENNLLPFLKKLNGVFSIIIIDLKQKKVHLINDRFGLKPLYYSTKNKYFAWNSTIKGLLKLPFVSKQLSQPSIDCFMEVGHLLGHHTYFEAIKLLPPACVLVYDYKKHSHQVEHYWTWSEVAPSQIAFEDAVEQTGQLFLQAVQRQFSPHSKMGVSLSGGLDSRLILAAIHKLYPDYRGFAYTFGQKGCLDARIAQKVAAITGWQHAFYPIHENNWLDNRLTSIKYTEGMKSIIHLHGCESIEAIKQNVDRNLSGFLGGAVLGGRSMRYYLGHPKKIDAELAKTVFGDFGALTDFDSEYYKNAQADFYVINNRGRRFINLGLRAISPYIKQSRPFLDQDFVSFLFSLPAEYRANHRLFKAVAIKFFEPFFKTIPWQQTGFPIKQKTTLFEQKRRSFLRRLRKMNWLTPKHYSNYQDWMMTPQMKELIKAALMEKNTPLLLCFDKSILESSYQQYLQNNKGAMMRIARLFTLYYYFSSLKGHVLISDKTPPM